MNHSEDLGEIKHPKKNLGFSRAVFSKVKIKTCEMLWKHAHSEYDDNRGYGSHNLGIFSISGSRKCSGLLGKLARRWSFELQANARIGNSDDQQRKKILYLTNMKSVNAFLACRLGQSS